MNKIIFMIVCFAIMATTLSACNSPKGDKDSGVIKDKANTKQSQENNSNDNNVADKIEWPSNIPDVVPEFTYGKCAGIVANGTADAKGGSLWSIGYKDLPDNASDKYKADLEDKGWKTNFLMGSLVAEYGAEEYTINLAHNKETQGAYLNIIKK